jgi:hypothetical protein
MDKYNLLYIYFFLLIRPKHGPPISKREKKIPPKFWKLLILGTKNICALYVQYKKTPLKKEILPFLRKNKKTTLLFKLWLSGTWCRHPGCTTGRCWLVGLPAGNVRHCPPVPRTAPGRSQTCYTWNREPHAIRLHWRMGHKPTTLPSHPPPRRHFVNYQIIYKYVVIVKNHLRQFLTNFFSIWEPWGSHLFPMSIVYIVIANSYSLHDVFTNIYSTIADFFLYGEKIFFPHKSIIYTPLDLASHNHEPGPENRKIRLSDMQSFSNTAQVQIHIARKLCLWTLYM